MTWTGIRERWKISAFLLFKDDWVPRIAEMTGLKELNLSNLTVEKIPSIPNKENLPCCESATVGS